MEQPVVLIPARMESRRFPGKPLAPIHGVPMVIRCAQNSIGAGLSTYVCTDSKVIAEVCASYGINCIITPDFNTGTDRVNWARVHLGVEACINYQGDEPLIHSAALREFANHMCAMPKDSNIIINGIAALDQKHAFDPNNVKAVINDSNDILYMSRKPLRNSTDPSKSPIYLKILGLYGFMGESLDAFASLPQGRLEISENAETLRWVEYNHSLKGYLLNTKSISVDTPEDLEEVEIYLTSIKPNKDSH